jgi:hypothetical protein
MAATHKCTDCTDDAEFKPFQFFFALRVEDMLKIKDLPGRSNKDFLGAIRDQ